MRLRILILLTAIASVLTIWAWMNNTFQIDFAATKNRHLINEKRNEIVRTMNIDSLREKSLQVIDKMNDRNRKQNHIATKVERLLSVTILLNLISLAVVLLEIQKRK
jgi:hypothetical protein